MMKGSGVGSVIVANGSGSGLGRPKTYGSGCRYATVAEITNGAAFQRS
jgi:hypothetical protein